MNPSFIVLYVAAALLVAYLGRSRLMGFLGFMVLALLIHPAFALAVLILTTPVTWRRGAKEPPEFRPLREGERRPFLPQRRRKPAADPPPSEP